MIGTGKKLFITSVAILFLTTVFGQELKEREWKLDLNNARVNDIDFDSNGNIYLANTVPGWDTAVALAMKVNSNLELEWARELRSVDRGGLHSVVVLSDGDLLLGGHELDVLNDSIITDKVPTLYKMDSDGNLLGASSYRGGEDGEIRFIFELPNGNLLLALDEAFVGRPTQFLETNSNGAILNQFSLNFNQFDLSLGISFISIRKIGSVFYGVGTVLNQDYDEVAMMVAFNLEEVIWAKTFDPDKYNVSIQSLENRPDGGFLIMAEFFDLDLDLASDIWMFAVDQEGNPEWSKQLYRENEFNEFLFGILQSSLGGVVFLPGGDFLFSQFHQLGSQGYVYVPAISRFNSEGDLQWVKQKDGSGLMYIDLLSDNLMLMAGAGIEGGTVLGTSTTDGLLACGESQSSEMSVIDVDITTEDKVVYFNYSDEVIGEDNSSTFALDVDITEETHCSFTLSDNTTRINEESISVFPVPAIQSLFINLKDPGLHDSSISLVDIMGKVHPTQIIGTSEGLVELNVENLAAGVYILEIRNEAGMSARKKIVVER